MDAEAPVRLGWYSYLNCLPLRAFWRTKVAVNEVIAPPDQLAEMMLQGQVDVAPISLIEYLRAADSLQPLPVAAIGSDGPVMSCVLVTRRDPEELEGRVVALSTASRTSVTLARILLSNDAGVRPVYQSGTGNTMDLLRGADAAVIIGDEALAAHERPPAGTKVVDLGSWWRRWAGAPMVFAVWAARAEIVASRQKQVCALGTALARAAEEARLRTGALVLPPSASRPIKPATLRQYFRVLDYRLGPDQVNGIRRFAEEAMRDGALPSGREVLERVERICPTRPISLLDERHQERVLELGRPL
ncbi:MAG TPA: menaquinone biosynthesis protein [Kineosporiaceae bacterium]